MSDNAGPTVRDALQVAQRALAKANELERDNADLRERLADAEADITALELRVSEHDQDRPYDAYTRDDKIGMVREHGFERAVDRGGHAALDAEDVRWEVFNGEPSPSHCYDLLRWAAYGQDDGDGPRGFRVDDPDDGVIQLRVDADAAKRSRAYFSAKNAAGEGGL